MDRLRQSLQRFLSLFRRARLDQEHDAEVAAHLDLAIDENRKNGMSAEEARRQALIQLITAIIEASRGSKRCFVICVLRYACCVKVPASA